MNIAIIGATGNVGRKLLEVIEKLNFEFSELYLIASDKSVGKKIAFKNKNIIANANCSTIQLVLALKPLHDKFKIKRVVVSTYQSVSGAGKNHMTELEEQSKSVLNKQKVS